MIRNKLASFAWASGPGAFVGGFDVGRSERVRVPNPDKVPKGRLDAPPGRPHRKKKRYRRRPKHPADGAE